MNLFLLIYHNGGSTHHYFHGLGRAVAHLILTDVDAALLRFGYTHTVDSVPCGTYHRCLTVSYDFVNICIQGIVDVIRLVGITVPVVQQLEVVEASPVVRNLTCLTYA